MPFRTSTPRFLFELLKARGRFNRMADAVARKDGMLPRGDLVEALRANAEHPWKPPGAGYEVALTHDVVHGLDITRPLAIERRIPAEPMRVVLGVLASPKSRRHFRVAVDGVELQAVDLDWSWGSGEPLRGPAKDLVLLLTGRPVQPEAFGGDGAERVANRADR